MILRIPKVLLLLSLVLLLSSCLQTRDTQKEVEEKQVLKKQLSTLQMTTADANSRFQDVEDDNRKLAGRVEALEAKLQALNAKTDKSNSTQDQRAKESNDLFREEFAKLAGEINQLKAQMNAIHDDQRKAHEQRAANEAAAASRAAESAKNPLASAEEKYDKKMWKEAILDYEKYRSSNPKGKSFSMATYKIGVCFQELGMGEESKAFYEEVIAKFPKSKDAAKADSRLKALSKKKGSR